MSTPEEPLRLIGVRVENFLAVKLVDLKLEPDDHVTWIAGDNGNGKSSLLNAIQTALGGKRMMIDANGVPLSEPVRKGADKARIFLDIGHLTSELTVEVIITADSFKLVVRGADGKVKASPQALLDKLYSTIAFDPESFQRMKPPEQVETLRKLTGLDFTALDAKRAKAYQDRTLAGRLLEAAKAKLTEFPWHDDAPAERQDVPSLQSKLFEAKRHNQEKIILETARGASSQRALAAANASKLCKENISRLEKQLADEKARLATREADELQAGQELLSAEKKLADFIPMDEAPLASAVIDADANNRKADTNLRHLEQKSEVDHQQNEVDRLTSEISGIDSQKEGELAFAQFPMEGLAFTDSQVTFQGIPLNQRSQAEQSRISVAIAAALNPRLPLVLIRNGSLYDKKSRAAIIDEAKRRNLRVLIEVVESSEPAAVVIQQGEVVHRGGAEARRDLPI